MNPARARTAPATAHLLRCLRPARRWRLGRRRPALVSRAAFGVLALLAWMGMASTAWAQEFDPLHTRIGFQLHTRWGQQLQGRFPRYEGRVSLLADGRQQVHVRLASNDVEIVGYPRYTDFARGPRFFDARRHPWVSFASDPYAPELLRAGGKLGGTLRIHGVAQHEAFIVEPAACARPAIDCDLVARGSVRREDYGMDDWTFAVRGRVRFELRLRLQAAL